MRQGKSGILAQNPLTDERKLRLRWLLGISSIPLFAIITAFGLAPQSVDQPVEIKPVIEDIVLPEISRTTSAEQAASLPLWQAELIQRDDTISSLLSRLNIRNPEALDFLRRSPSANSLASQLRPGRTVYAKTDLNGNLIELLYQTDADSALHVSLGNSGYFAEQKPLAIENRTLVKSAVIQSSLFAATDAADIPDQIAIQIADIFSSEIDFHLDLRKGDHFSVVYDASFHDGELLKSGHVVAVEFVNQGKTYRAVQYRDHEGHVNYYTPEGKSLHKSFLRTPVEFSRISSGFSLARFHPVLQKWRAHKGVDYAAPIGTRIKSTADGTVAFVGTQNGYGNVVILNHAGGISTVYGHLSHFAPGLRLGKKVSQGDFIGQVGMSGMATGPHLHYEFRVHGEHRDPVKVALPAVAPLNRSELVHFLDLSKPLLSNLDLVSRTLTAYND